MKPYRLSYFVLFLVLGFGGSMSAQSDSDYAALATFLPAEKLNNQTEHPELFAKIAYLNRNGYHVGIAGDKDVSGYPETSEIPALYPNLPAITLGLIESKEMNMMGYDFKPESNKYLYFRITGSDKVLVIPPTNQSLKNITDDE